jgi:hypothetical protein
MSRKSWTRNDYTLFFSFSLRSSSSSEWVHLLYLMLYIHTNSICSAPDVSNDKSKNEQIKSMLRVIDRIASNISLKKKENVLLSHLLIWNMCWKQTFSLISFYTNNDLSMCLKRKFFSYYITLIIIYRHFFIQLSIVHILIKWIQCSSKRIIYLTFISHVMHFTEII